MKVDASRVDIAYRPIRVGWVLHSSDRASLRLAMRKSFCLAGGRYNPIILVDRPEAEFVVRAFRVDLLEPVGNHPDIGPFIERFPHLASPLMGAMFDARDRQLFTSCALLDVLNCIRVWRDRSNWADWTSTESGLRPPIWQADDPLADVLLAEFGGYPDPDLVGRDYGDAISGSVPMQ